jgi:hypothetical protein
MDLLMKSIRRLAMILATPAFLPSQASAIEPASVDFLGFQFTPTLKVGEAFDDNFREVENDKQSSWITTVAPGFEFKAEDRNSAYRLTYLGSREIFHDAENASHTDHDLKLESILEFTSRNRLNLEAGYAKKEITNSTSVVDINDKYHTQYVGGVFSYGAQTAANRIDLSARYQQMRFDNSGDINADEERDSTSLGAVWFHRLGGATRALIEVRHNDYDYLTPNSPRNSFENALLVGGTWDATARTTGKVRVGYAKKDFEDSSRKDLSSPMLEAGIDWAPLTYSKFSVNARQAFDEGDDGADAIKSTSAGVAWAHGWSERVVTTTTYSLTRLAYEGQDRTDDISEAGVAVAYKMRRWLDISLGYRHRVNDSTFDDQSFNRNIYLISFTASL